jgi:hypothetical protein
MGAQLTRGLHIQAPVKQHTRTIPTIVIGGHLHSIHFTVTRGNGKAHPTMEPN